MESEVDGERGICRERGYAERDGERGICRERVYGEKNGEREDMQREIERGIWREIW